MLLLGGGTLGGWGPRGAPVGSLHVGHTCVLSRGLPGLLKTKVACGQRVGPHVSPARWAYHFPVLMSLFLLHSLLSVHPQLFWVIQVISVIQVQHAWKMLACWMLLQPGSGCGALSSKLAAPATAPSPGRALAPAALGTAELKPRKMSSGLARRWMRVFRHALLDVGT